MGVWMREFDKMGGGEGQRKLEMACTAGGILSSGDVGGDLEPSMLCSGETGGKSRSGVNCCCAETCRALCVVDFCSLFVRDVFLKNNWSVGIDLLVCYVRLESVLVKWLYVEAWGESKPIRPRY